MGLTFRYLALDDDQGLVLDWFRALRPAPREIPAERGLVFYFENLGQLAYNDGQVDASRSPVVTLFAPRKRRGALWTAGEIHFLPTPLRQQFPTLTRTGRQLATWLSGFPRVFERPAATGNWDYYLEGTLRNRDTPLFALPSAMAALQRGQYFVADDDTEFLLDKLCKSLRLRGVMGTTESEA